MANAQEYQYEKEETDKRGGGGWVITAKRGGDSYEMTPGPKTNKKYSGESITIDSGSDFVNYGTIDGQPIARPNDGSKAVDYARKVTPEALDQDRVSGPLADYNYKFYEYSDQGQPVYNPDRINEEKDNLFYDTYTLGRGNVTVDIMADRQMKAAALLAAEEQTGQRIFNKKDRERLQRLADLKTNLPEIDRIRDQRIKGTLDARKPRRGGSGPRRRLTAAEAEGREQLLSISWRGYDS